MGAPAAKIPAVSLADDDKLRLAHHIAMPSAHLKITSRGTGNSLYIYICFYNY